MPGHIKRVHEYTVDRPGDGQPGVAKIISVNPLVRFVSAAHPPVVWQGGKWMDDSGRLVDEATVPDYCREQIRLRLERANPPKVTEPEMLVRCDFCEEFTIPSSQYAQHLIDNHVPKAPEAPAEASPAAEIHVPKREATGRRSSAVVQAAGA